MDFYDRRPEDLATIGILKLRKQIESKGLSAATVKHILVLLRILLNWGAKNGLCTSINPEKLQFDIPKLDNERTESMTDDQIHAYIDALDQEQDQNLASLFRLALVTGMRKSALLNLRWDDCDFENRVITLRGEVAKKGKTEYIPMNDAALHVLLAMQRIESAYISPGKNGGHRKELRRMAQRVKGRLVCLKISGHCTVSDTHLLPI